MFLKSNAIQDDPPKASPDARREFQADAVSDMVINSSKRVHAFDPLEISYVGRNGEKILELDQENEDGRVGAYDGEGSITIGSGTEMVEMILKVKLRAHVQRIHSKVSVTKFRATLGRY